MKTSAPDPGVVGNPLTFSITVTNLGPGAATDVVLTDPLATSLIFVSAAATVGSCTFAAGVVTCALGTLQNQSAEVVTIVTIPQMTGIVSNTSIVRSSDAEEEGSTHTSPIVTPTPVAIPVISSAGDPWAIALVLMMLAAIVIALRRVGAGR